MASFPEHRAAVRAGVEIGVPLPYIGVHAVANRFFVGHDRERHITADAPTERLPFEIESGCSGKFVKLFDRIIRENAHQLQRCRIFRRDPTIARHEDATVAVGGKDQFVSTNAGGPTGIVSECAEVFAQTNHHVIHHEPRFVFMLVHLPPLVHVLLKHASTSL